MSTGEQHDHTSASTRAGYTPHTGSGAGATLGLGAAVGIVGAVLGLLPWIVTGMHLPLQNLWETSVADERDMPIAFLPFNQYFLTFLAALLLTGAGIVGVTARRLHGRLGRPGVFAAFGGLLLVQVVAVVQTTVVTTAGLGMDRTVGTGGAISASEIYVVALVVGSALTVLLGAGLVLLLALAPDGVAVVALAVVAVALAEWLRGFVLPPATLSTGLQSTIAGWAWWVAPVVVGLGIAVTGVRSAGQVVGVLVALVVLLVGPALLTAVDGAAGMRVLAPYPLELVAFGSGLFGDVLGRGLVAVVLAAVIGWVGVALLRRRPTGRRSTGLRAPDPPSSDPPSSGTR
ncbi:hypothetical protein DEJ25_01940 [Curtobacterium sp. MCPF17_011]|uniref:hypothetical protein n=1 Tax=Curtobacterium sp. MCPF17_011 TaxID=2175652 RepID=UPI000DAA4950|nr:hypothetical protein [Curtobacterium sp. MCPF17_011]PZF15511.1 hypothetical protein DEJ25_01940 [Curtobacterium sp. MCPF17_011]